MPYDVDILEDFDRARRAPRHPEIEVETSMVVADRSSGHRGKVVRWNAAAVTIEDERGSVRHFRWKPGGFVVDGRSVTLVRPKSAPTATQRITASGSIAGDGGTRVARASRIWVEGVHDADLLERVWGDDLRELGVVVEPLHGADDLVSAVDEFGPGAGRRLGVLLDHLIPGSKETRIAERVRHPHVMVAGHPFVDVWAGIRPRVMGLDRWPEVPHDPDVPWKEGLCARLGRPFDGFWTDLRSRVGSFVDLEPELVGAVESLIDFVSAED